MAPRSSVNHQPSPRLAHRDKSGVDSPTGLFQASTTLTLEPGHGEYFNMAHPADEVLIQTITVRTTSPELKAQIMIFNCTQKSEDPDEYDICYEQTFTGRRVIHLRPEPQYYRDEDGCAHLHGGILLHDRPVRFDLDGPELHSYLEKPATFEISICFGLASLQDESGPTGGRSLAAREVIDSFLKIKRYKRLKEASLLTYQKHLAHFEKAYPVLPENQDDILEYLSRFDGYSGRTRLNRQSELMQLYSFASRQFDIANPVSGLPRSRIIHQPIKTLSLGEVARLDQTPDSERERAALDLLLGHGWRQIEVRRITAGDVRKMRNGMIWVHGKEREEYAPLLPETRERLEAMAEGLEDNGPIFRGRTRGDLGETGMTKMIARLYARAGLDGYSGHDLRRTFATLVREHSGDELLAMRLLRDQVPFLNSRYIAFSETALREGLELYSPLRLIHKSSPSELEGENKKLAGEILVETGEGRTPRPKEATQNVLQA